MGAAAPQLPPLFVERPCLLKIPDSRRPIPEGQSSVALVHELSRAGGPSMLGPPKLRCLDQPIPVSLEDLVPRDHFYRHLDATLDLSFVRVWVHDWYAEGGRPSIDPVVFF